MNTGGCGAFDLPTIELAHLLLRPFALGDAEDVRRLAGDRAIADTTLTIPHPYEAGMAETWIATHRPEAAAGRRLTLAIVLRNTGELAGAIGLHGLDSAHRRAELGYWIGRPWWNRGFATEAARALIDYGFATLHLNRIFAQHMIRNPASGRVMEKAGLTREGVLRSHIGKGDRFEDMAVYGILRSEWDAHPH